MKNGIYNAGQKKFKFDSPKNNLKKITVGFETPYFRFWYECGMFGEVSWEEQRWQVVEEFESAASEIMK